MLKKINAFFASFLLSFASLFVLAPTVHAAAISWDGEGSDNNFSTATNWVGDTVPVDGDSLVFPTSVDADAIYGDDRDINNDISGLDLAGIQVSGTYGAGDYDYYAITGSAISLSGNVTGNSESLATPTLGLSVAITATANIIMQSVYSTSALDIGSNTVTLSNSYFSGAYSGTGGSLVLSGLDVSNSGGDGCYSGSPTSNSPSFASTITLNNNGFITVSINTQELAYAATSLTLNDGGSLLFDLSFGQDITFNKAVTLNGGTVSATQLDDDDVSCTSPSTNKQVIIPGNVTITADTVFKMFDADIKFTGTVTGKEFIKPYFASNGSVIFSDGSSIKPTPITTNYAANSPATSIYVANNETAVVTGTYGSVSVFEGGTLKGSGTVGILNVSAGGKLAPGLSPGCLNSGNLTLAGTFEAEIGGTTVCTQYDQTTVTGTVNVTGGTLVTSRYNNFTPVAGQTYTIISNDAADAVTGTFANLAEGATFTVDGYVLKVSYVGGDGNDVVLTVVSVPAVPDTGFALLTANPIVTLITTTLLAGGVALLARRYKKITTG